MTTSSPDSPIELLRLSTAGSVDDGTRTLIGRLLYDTKSLFEDQIEQVEAASRKRGDAATDLSLFTDGLRAERAQKITLDVAYRFFSTFSTPATWAPERRRPSSPSSSSMLERAS